MSLDFDTYRSFPAAVAALTVVTSVSDCKPKDLCGWWPSGPQTHIQFNSVLLRRSSSVGSNTAGLTEAVARDHSAGCANHWRARSLNQRAHPGLFILPFRLRLFPFCL